MEGEGRGVGIQERSEKQKAGSREKKTFKVELRGDGGGAG